MTTPTAAHDFHFLAGRWRVQHRRLRQRLRGSTEWECFDSRSEHQTLPGGVCNFDTLVAEDWRPGWVGMSFRVYDPRADRWSIYWCTNEGGGVHALSGQLDPPVVGRFDGDVGIFEGDDELDGRPIRVRYTWTRQGPDTARWEQAFSPDAGLSWEPNWVMDFVREAAPAMPLARPVADIACEVVELRRYTLHPGQRETLIELFEREFIESQEAAGMAVMGQFREPAAPDRFTWLRGFPSMASRSQALEAFYSGPVWREHGAAANATMIDSDDVRLLRPAWPGAGVAMQGRSRTVGEVRCALPRRLEVAIVPLHEPASPELLSPCREHWPALLAAAGAEIIGVYTDEPAANNFPRLPVRRDGPLLVLLLIGDGAALEPALAPWRAAPIERLQLLPTARSALP